MTWIIVAAIFAAAFVYWAHRDTAARMMESRSKEAVAKACGPDPRVVTMIQRAQDAMDNAQRIAERTVAALERFADMPPALASLQADNLVRPRFGHREQDDPTTGGDAA